jgi:hypothetical protein
MAPSTLTAAGQQTMGMLPGALLTMAPENAPQAPNPCCNPPSSSSSVARSPAPTTYYPPVPAPAPALIDGHSTAQWKEASAFHEHHAKQLTVQAHELRASMHEAVRAESESRINNESLMAKDERIQRALTRKTALTQKLQLEATMQTQLLQASEASRGSLQKLLDSAIAKNLELEKSCLQLMTTVSAKDKEITDAQLQLSQHDNWASQEEWASQEQQASNEQWEELQLQKLKLKRASPAKKLKSKKTKKVRPAPKGTDVKTITPPSDTDLQIQARKAFPIEYGDRGPERRARERDIAILHEKLVSQRDGKTLEMDIATSKQEAHTSAEEPGSETRHLANTFAW